MKFNVTEVEFDFDDDHIFIFDRDMTPNEITLNVEWRD